MTTRPNPLEDPHTITEDRAKLLAMHATYVAGAPLTPEAAAKMLQTDIANGAQVDAAYWDRILSEVMAAVSAKPPTDDQVKPLAVEARAGSKLEQLHARYYALKAERDAAAEAFDAVAAEIKSELGTRAAETDATKVQLISKAGAPLRLTYSESWRVDSTRLKREDPETYVKWAKKSGSWSLTVGKGA